jgi:hypothetical protein
MRPWRGIHVAPKLCDRRSAICDRSSFVFVFAVVPASVYCLPAKTGPTTHVPTCSVSFSDEADRGVAAMFAFCVYRVSDRMMGNAHGRRESCCVVDVVFVGLFV